MAMNVPCVAVRGSTGLSLSYGPPTYEDVTSFVKDDNKSCRSMAFSPDGKYFAWISTPMVKIALCSTWKVITCIEKPKVCAIQFSPLGTFLATWEPFVVSQGNPNGNPQLHIWRSENGEHVKGFTQRRQIDWNPEWSSDEKLCGLLVNNDVIFYENSNFDKIAQRIKWSKVNKYKISPGSAPYHIICYMPGAVGQPSLAHLFQYPNINAEQSLVKRSFFQADRINIDWNKIGNSALVMTIMDVDSTGTSYYGKQSLHYFNTKGDAMMITVGGQEPIQAIKWSPRGDEFCVIHGFMPPKATIFNLKCDPVFEFPSKPRNSIYYNPHGNIVLLGGFGNLRGNIELWDVNKKKLIATCKAPDTTLLEWSPDGEHFMTATTAPRLQISNVYKIWHYTGSLLHERPWKAEEKLWEVLWQVFPASSFIEKSITYKAVEGIASSQPQESKEVYRPPFLFKNFVQTKTIEPNNNPSKTALKYKKKRGAKKAKKEMAANLDSTTTSPNINGEKSNTIPKTKSESGVNEHNLTNNPVKNQQIKKIQAKLKQISKLKLQLTFGKTLEINQLEKIKKEDELLKELHDLTL